MSLPSTLSASRSERSDDRASRHLSGTDLRRTWSYVRFVDFNTYRHAYLTDPPPEQRFDLRGVLGITLFYSDYAAAVDFYTRVLGAPAYVEGEGTRGWQVGDTWLTLLAGGDSGPRNVEVPIVASTPDEAERLQAALIDAGASGPRPQDGLMYEPVRLCPVTDPFGTELLIYARLDAGSIE